MHTRQQLEQRVAELERQVAATRHGYRHAVRKRSPYQVMGLPWYDVAIGPDPARNELRGHAKGFIAVGDIATGVFALGGVARGVFTLGGVSIGVFSVGGLAIGALVAAGGLGIGALAFGGGAIGNVAVGGGALGYSYACGGGAAGEHVVSAIERDPEAVAFFTEHGLGATCGAGFARRRR